MSGPSFWAYLLSTVIFFRLNVKRTFCVVVYHLVCPLIVCQCKSVLAPKVKFGAKTMFLMFDVRNRPSFSLTNNL